MLVPGSMILKHSFGGVSFFTFILSICCYDKIARPVPKAMLTRGTSIVAYQDSLIKAGFVLCSTLS